MFEIFLSFIAVIPMILPFGLYLGISMPFVGALVRYRTNYTPKSGAVHLDREDGLAATPSSHSISYLGMMKRVHRIEGWAGLYKGTMPSIITSLIVVVVIFPINILITLGYRILPDGDISLWVISFALSTIHVLVLIPMQIITNRAITTPHRLATFNAPAGLRILLSPAERTQPSSLYLAPGVALAAVLEGLVGPALALLYVLAVPHLPRFPGVVSTALVIALAIAIVTPLQVIRARLTLQRLGPETNDEPPAYAAEEVMDFRAHAAPYTGLVDCARTIVREEGARSLFRAWWLTAFLILLPMIPANGLFFSRGMNLV
ncbi:hypothetical protein DFH09DRAFT_1178101 [Mycena vulgaris]|nr:hypothetical protein DFH09DRAFT_1178101 [Mycena vulgaris]